MRGGAEAERHARELIQVTLEQKDDGLPCDRRGGFDDGGVGGDLGTRRADQGEAMEDEEEEGREGE